MTKNVSYAYLSYIWCFLTDFLLQRSKSPNSRSQVPQGPRRVGQQPSWNGGSEGKYIFCRFINLICNLMSINDNLSGVQILPQDVLTNVTDSSLGVHCAPHVFSKSMSQKDFFFKKKFWWKVRSTHGCSIIFLQDSPNGSQKNTFGVKFYPKAGMPLLTQSLHLIGA